MTTAPSGLRRLGVGLVLLIPVVLAGCGGGSSTSSTSTSGTPSGFDFGSNNPMLVVAFGDSITQGFLEGGVITSNNYPNNLQAMLRSLNSAWRVRNRGLGGEEAQEGAARLPGVLASDQPGFVLVMEGTNNAGNVDDPAFIVASLQAMVERAQGNRTIPVLGTIPPNFRDFSNAPQVHFVIDQSNAMIRTLASSHRVVLAEIFNNMNDPSLFGSPGGDPHHPNEGGYVVMAGIWFDAMQRAIPVAAPPPPPPPPAGEPTPAPPGGLARSKGQRAKRR